MSPSISTSMPNATLTLNGTTIPLNNFTVTAAAAASSMQTVGNAYVTAPSITSNYTITATTPVQWQWQQPTYQQQTPVPIRTRRVVVPSGQNYVDIVERDDDGWPIRRPPPREFNKFLNASDLLEEFIKYVGDEGVRADEFMALPVELFIKWLVIRACEQDHEEPNVTLELPSPTPRRHGARCLGCGRYMRSAPVALHEPCAPRYFNRQLEAA